MKKAQESTVDNGRLIVDLEIIAKLMQIPSGQSQSTAQQDISISPSVGISPIMLMS